MRGAGLHVSWPRDKAQRVSWGRADEGILHLGIYRCWLFFGTNRSVFWRESFSFLVWTVQFFGMNRSVFWYEPFSFLVRIVAPLCLWYPSWLIRLSWYVRHAIGISHNTENQYLGVSYNIIAWVKSGMPWQLLSAIQTDNFEHFWMTWEPSIFGCSRHHWPGWKGMPAAQIAAASIARATLGCAEEWTMDGNLIIQRTEKRRTLAEEAAKLNS